MQWGRKSRRRRGVREGRNAENPDERTQRRDEGL